MPESIPLTPEAAAVVAAFDAVMDRAGVFEGATDALAAALRELADQLQNAPILSQKVVWEERVASHNRITAIAENIEQAITYAENHNG